MMTREQRGALSSPFLSPCACVRRAYARFCNHLVSSPYFSAYDVPRQINISRLIGAHTGGEHAVIHCAGSIEA